MTELQFHGRGTEYFKIWIVNILLTLVTLGLYYPWAKVRTRRYFYGNTEFDNANFDYHASGKQLFLSYLIATILFALYVGLSQINPVLSIAISAFFFLALPWIVYRGIHFNHRMSSYRNVRFGFNGSLANSYKVFFGYPLVMLFVVGAIGVIAGVIGSAAGETGQTLSSAFIGLLVLFAYPTFFALMNKVTTDYFINGAHFGQEQFFATLKFKSFFAIMLKGMGLGILLAIITMMVVGMLAYATIGLESLSSLTTNMQNMKNGTEPELGFFIAIFSVYAFLIPVSMYMVAYFKARHRSYIFSQMSLGDNINFESSLSSIKYFGILLTNLILIILTAGLAYPWTKVRAHRYLTESITINAPDGFAGYVSKHGKGGALGEELGDAFDIDVGGIAF